MGVILENRQTEQVEKSMLTEYRAGYKDGKSTVINALEIWLNGREKLNENFKQVDLKELREVLTWFREKI